MVLEQSIRIDYSISLEFLVWDISVRMTFVFSPISELVCVHNERQKYRILFPGKTQHVRFFRNKNIHPFLMMIKLQLQLMAIHDNVCLILYVNNNSTWIFPVVSYEIFL